MAGGNVEQAAKVKISITGAIGALSAIVGWFGVLFIVWIILGVVDYLSGTLVASKNKEWNSAAARWGMIGKLAGFLVVLAAIALDIVAGSIINELDLFSFTYTMLMSPFVLVYYSITEIGSIAENAVKLGAPAPPFFLKAIDVAETKITEAGDAMVDKMGGPKEG